MQRLPNLLALFVCVALAVSYTTTQERTEYREGRPYDGETYWYQAQLVAADHPIRNWKPFCYRLGAPYVVGKLAKAAPEPPAEGPKPSWDLRDPLDGFTLLGWVCAVLSAVLLYNILRRYGLGQTLCLGLVALYIAHPIGPFRFSPFFPAFSDPLAFVFFFGLFLTYKLDPKLSAGTTAVLCALGFVGAFVRETVLLVPLTFLGVHGWNALRGRTGCFTQRTLFHLLPIASIAIALFFTRLLVDEAMGEYTTLGHAQKIWNRNAQFPEILLLALFTALGPFVFWLLASLCRAPARGFLAQHPEIPIYLVGMLALAVTGGNHTDRFVYWMLVAVLPWFGFLLQERVAWPRTREVRWAFFGLLLVAQGLTYRIFHALPTQDLDSLNFPGEPGWYLLAPYGEGVTFGQTLAAFMTRENRLPLLGQFALLGLLLLGLRMWDARRTGKAAGTPTGPPWIES